MASAAVVDSRPPADALYALEVTAITGAQLAASHRYVTATMLGFGGSRRGRPQSCSDCSQPATSEPLACKTDVHMARAIVHYGLSKLFATFFRCCKTHKPLHRLSSIVVKYMLLWIQ